MPEYDHRAFAPSVRCVDSAELRFLDDRLNTAARYSSEAQELLGSIATMYIGCSLQRLQGIACYGDMALRSAREYAAQHAAEIDASVVEHEAYKRHTLRMDLPEKFTEVVRAIDIAAERTFGILARSADWPPRGMRRQSGYCEDVSHVLCEVLAREHNLQFDHRFGGQNERRMSHTFLRVHTEYGDLDADATWQQFLPGDAPYDKFPHVMITQPDKWPARLDHFVDPSYMPIWTESRIPRYTEPSREVIKLFNEQGWAQQ